MRLWTYALVMLCTIIVNTSRSLIYVGDACYYDVDERNSLLHLFEYLSIRLAMHFGSNCVVGLELFLKKIMNIREHDLRLRD